jgi:hypothetical protein
MTKKSIVNMYTFICFFYLCFAWKFQQSAKITDFVGIGKRGSGTEIDGTILEI